MKTCLRGFANNTGADQPAHPRSLISAFIIRYLENIICQLATGEILIFKLVSVAEETGLKLASDLQHFHKELENTYDHATTNLRFHSNEASKDLMSII